MGKTSLVTGAAGFLGSHVAEALAEAGHHVVGVDDLSGGFKESVPPTVSFIEGDVTDVNVVNSIFEQFSFDYVFHLAAYAAEGLSHFIKAFNYRNNVGGSVNLINAAVNAGTVRCFVFTSSIAVYGSTPPPMREDTTPRPDDPYGIAKYAVEQELRVTHDMFGLPYVIFRPHNVYGERQHLGDRYRNVLGIFMNQALRGEPFTIFGDGTQERAFTYVGDIAPIIAGSVDVPDAYGEIFNVGSDEVTTVAELAAVVAEAMHVPLRIDHLPPRLEAVRAFSTHDKARSVFGQGPATDLRTGVRRMAGWARARAPMEPSVFEGIEIERNLPPSWAAVVGTRPGGLT